MSPETSSQPGAGGEATLVEKLWRPHVVHGPDDGPALLDRRQGVIHVIGPE